jgi:hypothetical protein
MRQTGESSASFSAGAAIDDVSVNEFFCVKTKLTYSLVTSTGSKNRRGFAV